MNKIIGEMKAGEIEKMAPSSLRATEIQEALHAFWGGPQIATAGRAFGREFVDAFNEGMQRRGSQWYERHNPKVMRYVTRTTSRELGFEPPPEAGTEEVPWPSGPPPEAPPPPGAPPPRPPKGRPGIGPRRPRPPRGRPGIGV